MHLRTLADDRKIRDAFDQFDKDGDGFVSRSDVIECVRANIGYKRDLSVLTVYKSEWTAMDIVRLSFRTHIRV